jgi:dienelactone hydrolase
MKRILGLISLLLVTACSESFLPAWAVTDLRAVAAPVEVEGKPGRARPDPEDRIQVSILVVGAGVDATVVAVVVHRLRSAAHPHRSTDLPGADSALRWL